MHKSNGVSRDECLTDFEFKEFIRTKWEPHTNTMEDTMTRVAGAVDQIAGVMKWAAKGLLGLLMLLILINATTAIIQQIKDTNTSFKGTIGGAHGAQIEIKKEVKP
jgi:hypothetical protein